MFSRYFRKKERIQEIDENTEEIKQTHPLLENLSDKQKLAVLSKNKRVLVLAGAGSGKTKTLIQKIIYLMFVENVKSRNILAITFTKNAANEMIDRLILTADESESYRKIINNKKIKKTDKDKAREEYRCKYPWIKNITAKTFHSLCYSIMRNHGNPEFDNKFKLLLEKIDGEEVENRHRAKETQDEIIKDIIVNKCQNINFMLKLKRYIIDFYVDKIKNFQEQPGFVDYKKPFTTLRGEKVRSKSERYIADWLYAHNIDYIYEPTINLKDFDFKPDFFIPSINTYIEHVSNLSKGIKNKEQQFELTNHTLFKTYEHMTYDINKFYEALDRIVFVRLDKKLAKESTLSFENEFRSYHDKLYFFTQYCKSAIDKIKVSNQNIDDVCRRSSENPHDRVRIFYELFEPIYDDYIRYCTQRSYLDFNDLLIKTVKLMKNHPEINNLYQHLFHFVLVDEFQDVNSIQIELLKELTNENNQLFCVGDDWQSIYGFRGSEVEYIVNFKKYFPEADIVNLEINYRSNNIIVNASNEVIKNNKFKLDKEIKSINTSGKKIYLYCAKKESEDGVDIVVKKIKQFYEAGYSKEDILILYRRTETYKPYLFRFRELGMQVQAKTIHASKGLEATIVFIIGLKEGIGGFPNVWEDDIIFQQIKKTNYELLMEEERRLFYVALTRAKNEVFLVSEKDNESIFVEEIPGEFVDRENFLILNMQKHNNKCSHCQTEIQDSFNFCPNCGHKIGDSQTEKNIGLSILECLDSIQFNAGRRLLANTLKGSKTAVNISTELSKNDYFAMLHEMTITNIMKLIDELIEKGFIQIYYSNSQFPLLKLTNKGKDCLHNNTEIELLPKETHSLKKDKGTIADTVYKTYYFHKEGKTIKEIASLRKLKEDTIYDHFRSLISKSWINPNEIIPLEKRKRILNVLKKGDHTYLRDIKEKLGEDIGYAEIKCMLSFINRDSNLLDEMQRKKGTY